MVRLVRACGSKLCKQYICNNVRTGQARKSLWIETKYSNKYGSWSDGQARKSLWIETAQALECWTELHGQARKSLWIETVI